MPSKAATLRAPRPVVLGFVAAVIIAFLIPVGLTMLMRHDEPTGPSPAAPVPDGTFTIAVLPDTQYATAADVDPDASVLFDQTTWLAVNKDALHLHLVLHEGDVVDSACEPAQWDRAVRAMSLLTTAKIPYLISAGNHDVRHYEGCTTGDPVDHPAEYDAAFPLSAARTMEGFGGSFSDTDARNTYSTFRAGDQEFLVLSLEFGPRAEVADWALQVTRDHPDAQVILLTHDLIGPDGELRGGASTSTQAIPQPPRLTGQELWDRLIAPASNIVLTLNGHVVEGTTGRSVADDASGRPVQRLLANYQTAGGGVTGDLRLLTVDPAAGTIAVRTYSPVLDRWLTDDANQFTLTDLW